MTHRGEIILSFFLLLLPDAARTEDSGWAGAAPASILQEMREAKSGAAPANTGRTADVVLAKKLAQMLSKIQARARSVGTNLFDRPGTYLDTDFYGLIDDMGYDTARWLYASDTYDWAQPDREGNNLVRIISRETNRAMSDRQIMALLMTVKNQLIQPHAFQSFGSVSPFSSPSLVLFYSEAGKERDIPEDARILGEAVLDEARPAWSDPAAVCDSIKIPPMERGDKPTEYKLYSHKECTCIARSIRAVLWRRNLPTYTAGILKSAEMGDSQVVSPRRKFEGSDVAPHLNIPPGLRPYASKAQSGGFVASVEAGFVLSSLVDPDPLAKPNPPSGWPFHVAATFKMGEDTYVLDPIVSRAPLTLRRWIRMFENPRGILLVNSLSAVR